jgi:hypothetical protein
MSKWNWKRYVVGPDKNGKSAILMEEATNGFSAHMLWRGVRL